MRAPPMNQQASSRDRFLAVASDFFIREGFGPVGLDQIISAVGVTKTTFYKNFESKDALILAVLAHRHEVEMSGLTADIEARGGDDPRAQILAMFDVLHLWFAEPSFRGCIFLNAATEFPHESDPIHKAALAHGAALANLIREKAVAAGADRDTAQGVAAQMLVLINGAIFSRRTANQRDAALLAKHTAQILLDRMLTPT